MITLKNENTIFMMITLCLVLAGMLMIFSIAAIRDPMASLFLKHLIYLAIGFVCFFFMLHVDYHKLGDRRVLSSLVIITLGLLGLTFIPPFGREINGAYRWLILGPIRFQPSELAKFVLVLWLAVRLTQHQEKISRFAQGFILPFCMAGLFVGIILKQSDIGIPFVMLAATFVMIWVAGGRKLYLLGSCGLCLVGGILLISSRGYRMDRVCALMDPWKYRETIGFQLIQSLVALLQGKLLGTGPGGGEQKLGYLPAAHTDFIFATLGEEFGLVGTTITVALFVGMLYVALRISAKAPDLFGALLGIGISILLIVQAAFIIAVTIGLAPTKGLPLPLVSYGGSCLVISLLMIGVLMNIGIQGELARTEQQDKVRIAIWPRFLKFSRG